MIERLVHLLTIAIILVTTYPSVQSNSKDQGVGGLDNEAVDSFYHHTNNGYSFTSDDGAGPHSLWKRASYINRPGRWPRLIPYSFEETYNSTKMRYMMHKILDRIQDNVCVTFVDIGQQQDTKDPNWLKNHGFVTNSHLAFANDGNGCRAAIGEKKKRKVTIYPCASWPAAIHEVFHAMGSLHTFQLEDQQKYLSVHFKNIDNIHSTYKGRSGKNVNSDYIDPSSVLTYGFWYYKARGMKTYDFLRPEMGRLINWQRSTIGDFQQLSHNYKCAETFCSGTKRDCGPGYLALVKKKCACVCPDSYDPESNCTQLVTKVKGADSWPNFPLTVMMGGDKCPHGLKSSMLTLDLKLKTYKGHRLTEKDGKVQIGLCTNDVPNSNLDWYSMPAGRYCVGMSPGVKCSYPFGEKTWSFKVKKSRSVSLRGDVDSVFVKRKKVSMHYCCNKVGLIKANLPMDLPNDTPFSLFWTGEECQKIKGMWAIKSTNWIKASRWATLDTCYYLPPKYGCSKIFKLSADHRTAHISLPSTGSHREANRRCFYSFENPSNSRLRLSFQKFSIHPNDKFYVKRFNPWTQPFRITAKSYPTQMISERNYLSIEFWSYYKESSKYEGAELTVELLPDEEMCYPGNIDGSTYGGDKDISETYEQCLPWSEAVTCEDFPWTHALQLLNSGNKCRNLGNKAMLQPWCYVVINGTECVRRYCDVCNDAVPEDMIPDCQAKIKDDSSICSNPIKRLSCYKTCGLPTHPYNGKDVKCSKPEIPPELEVEGELEETYDLGSDVTVLCPKSKKRKKPLKITCAEHGWTNFPKKCLKSACIDKSQLCQNALSKVPELCSKISTDQCKKSCGQCNIASCEVRDGSTYLRVTPLSGILFTGQAGLLQCQPGLTLASGDLKRTCSDSGSLLGKEPQCTANVPPVDINLNTILGGKHGDRLFGKYSLAILTGPEYRIPFDGNLTTWYYYCKDNAYIYMLVYRPEMKKSTLRYKKISVTKVQCVQNRLWSYDVPRNAQINVIKGDVIGIYQSTDSLQHNYCFHNPVNARLEKNFYSPKALLRTRPHYFANVGNASKIYDYSEEVCLNLGLGARIEPLTLQASP